MVIDWLTLVIFFPLVGVVLMLFIPAKYQDTIKGVSLIIAFLTMLISFGIYYMFDTLGNGMQFEINEAWIVSLGINYHLGIDGISLLLIVLTTVLTVLCILSSWNAITVNVKGYYISMLFLSTGMIGVFCALDLFLFYVFWEVMLIPMYFIIGVWGGPRKIYAAIKFVLFTMFGSLLMLVALLYIYFEYARFSGEYSFDLFKIMDMPLAFRPQLWLFGAFALAFAIKVPLFPFHTWLPDAHVQAPTAGSVILAGVLLKMGTYGFVRICLPLFPQATLAYLPYICILAVIAIIYGALVSMVQKDVKSLVAFSSVSHMGFVMLGMFALNVEGLEGSVIQMINHGISTGALFLIVGMIYERRHTRLIDDFGGLAKVMPAFSTFFMIVVLSSIGLPFTNGFVGEFLILLGTFKENITLAVFATSGVVLAACYMLWMYQRVIFGKVTRPENENLPDLTAREKLILVPLVLLIFWIGIYPKPLFDRIEPAVKQILVRIDRIRLAANGDVTENNKMTFTDESSVKEVVFDERGSE
ncbi:MAG: NADH-quinone oxidoreductase subunit M [candidate division Zixibacteria bacterium]|nr:NADH-quinone oxidoreductase subunit M [candidate division Zixibacteria bacterium]MDD5425052.1 NADH-quinone oxidoreductase subunit M [candidate division Zixibacteria bacterium]